MPEGDTIWRTAAALRGRLEGRLLRQAEPGSLAVLGGRHLVAVEATGKHLHMRFDGGLALHSHMGMHGAWHVYAPGQPWRRPQRLAAAVLRFDGDVAVCFRPRILEVVTAGEDRIAHLGPDVLDEAFDASKAVARARAAARPTLGEMLLDQRVCAGVGNVYKCETLWRLRLDPWADPEAFDDGRLREVFEVARALMREALAGRGFARPVAVHRRAGRPCLRCGERIRIRAQGDDARLSYWCPRCQGTGAAAGAPAGGR